MQPKGPFKLQTQNLNLLRNVLNEVLHGFALGDVAGVIGMSANELAEFWKQVRDVPEGAQVELSLYQTMAFRNALKETLREFGVERTAELPSRLVGRVLFPKNQRDKKRSLTRAERQKLLDQQKGICPWCGKPTSLDKSVTHHVKRHADGGRTKKRNLRAVCKNPCRDQIHK